MRLAPAVFLVAACATEPTPPPPPQPIDVVWAQAIRPGDVVVMVPGTKSFDLLAAPIESLTGDDPVVDVRTMPDVANDSIVFEQAIAAAHRANVDPESLAFQLWGAGFTRLTQFEYTSYEGLHLHVGILGGENSCAKGTIITNLFNYTTQDADKDAHDLYTRTQAWVAANPAPDRHVIIASHSWGGAVAEWMDFNLTAYERDLGPTGAPFAFTLADGVPGAILNMPMAGPGVHLGSETFLYEVDRPDDPVHALDPSGDGDGHQYTILYGDEFQGSYGITTEEMSCRGVPGPCS